MTRKSETQAAIDQYTMFSATGTEAALIQDALSALDAWIQSEDFQGWDPYDAMNSPWLRRLAFGKRALGVGWVQLLKRSPFNFRPILGIPKGHNPKGMGLLMASYLRSYRLTGSPDSRDRARFLARWLEDNTSPGYSGACWGYNFDWPNRNFFAPAGTPTLVNTVFIANAFLDGYEWLGRKDWLEFSRNACRFILQDLNQYQDNSGLCFSYTPLDQRRVHNANVLAGALLARVAHHTREEELFEIGRRAIAFTVARQRPDGSWPYGEDRLDGFIDSYHTGFVLVALADYQTYHAYDNIHDHLIRGYVFFKRECLSEERIPKFSPKSLYPIDIHCVAQGILTFLRFQTLDEEAFDWALSLGRWGITNMQDDHGRFHYQIGRHYRIRIPYMRWGQAWMLRALMELLIALNRESGVD